MEADFPPPSGPLAHTCVGIAIIQAIKLHGHIWKWLAVETHWRLQSAGLGLQSEQNSSRIGNSCEWAFVSWTRHSIKSHFQMWLRHKNQMFKSLSFTRHSGVDAVPRLKRSARVGLWNLGNNKMWFDCLWSTDTINKAWLLVFWRNSEIKEIYCCVYIYIYVGIYVRVHCIYPDFLFCFN